MTRRFRWRSAIGRALAIPTLALTATLRAAPPAAPSRITRLPVLQASESASSFETAPVESRLPTGLVSPARVGDIPANPGCQSCDWLGPYLQRVETSDDSLGAELDTAASALPAEFVPWWDPLVRHPAGRTGYHLAVEVDSLVHNALSHSPHIQAVRVEPNIRRSVLVEECAEFDWRSFLESRYVDSNDPVGNTLTTGNNDDRFKDQTWSGQGGLRRRNTAGGEIEVSQRLGHQQNNSRFLVPQPQGTARLELAYTQPLLNGRGRPYNESRVVLARIETGSTEDKVVDTVQDHLLKVTEAYWDLYRARAEFFQRQRVLREAEGILDNLVGREQVDALERQVLRARAAVANRRSEMARAAVAIRNAESQLRLLVNDPSLQQSSGMEFVPGDAPTMESITMSMRDGLGTALRYRPDISLAIRTLSATSVRLGVAKNELLPQLDLLVSTYVAGLEGDSRVLSAFSNQFADGRPGFAVGLQFEVPIGNRGARARYDRRRWEMARATSEFRATVEQALTETEVAIREVQVTFQEMVGKYESMTATDRETQFLLDRWRILPGLDDSATLLLEDLLDSQSRRADEESAFVRAQVDYAVSLVRLRQSMGTLMRIEPLAHGVWSGAYPAESGSSEELPPPLEDARTSRAPRAAR